MRQYCIMNVGAVVWCVLVAGVVEQLQLSAVTGECSVLGWDMEEYVRRTLIVQYI